MTQSFDAKQEIDKRAAMNADASGFSRNASGKARLREIILQKRQEADMLEALLMALPERLTHDQAQGLRILIETKG